MSFYKFLRYVVQILPLLLHHQPCIINYFVYTKSLLLHFVDHIPLLNQYLPLQLVIYLNSLISNHRSLVLILILNNFIMIQIVVIDSSSFHIVLPVVLVLRSAHRPSCKRSTYFPILLCDKILEYNFISFDLLMCIIF